ncbi:MAG: hypothetical protein A2W00_09665, partial [Candidatus Eisenbacteria bacterium RBG_16_71_46]
MRMSRRESGRSGSTGRRRGTEGLESDPGQPHAHPSAPRSGGTLPLLLLALLVFAIGADVFRIGFFADDFHFLDVARRMPLGRVLLGHFGIWPWYRPLSRELFFYVVTLAGPASVFTARVLSLACLLGAAWALYRLGQLLFGRGAGIAAAALLVTYGYTKVFLSWGAGFQDLLATTLVLWAVLAHVEGRSSRALVLAALAPFAKESGFLVAPLILAFAFLVEGRRRLEPWMLRQALVWIAALGIHALVRTTWPPGGDAALHPYVARELPEAFVAIAQSFVYPGAPAGIATGLLGIAAAVAVWLLFGVSSPAGRGGSTFPAGRTIAFLSLGALLGMAPLLMLFFARYWVSNARFAYPAVPWLALLAGAGAARLPAPVLRFAVAALVLVNVW